MAIEIEKKYTVRTEGHIRHYLNNVLKGCKGRTKIEQGYLASGSGKTVRIRIEDNQRAILCIKMKRVPVGSYEYEYNIPLDEARHLLEVGCSGKVLSKIRYDLGRGLTVDAFEGPLQGLYLCEREFDSKEEADDFLPPEWCKAEVTDKSEYYNCNLVNLEYDAEKELLFPVDPVHGRR